MKIPSIAVSFAALVMALPVFAATPALPSSGVVSCVGAAVNTRETALGSGISAYTQSVVGAYSTRASALQQAYSSPATVRAGIKAAWAAFNSSIKSASQTWRTARASAWSQFRTAVKACKAPATATDSANSSSEASGQ